VAHNPGAPGVKEVLTDIMRKAGGEESRKTIGVSDSCLPPFLLSLLSLCFYSFGSFGGSRL
jgi:hypothetical protein